MDGHVGRARVKTNRDRSNDGEREARTRISVREKGNVSGAEHLALARAGANVRLVDGNSYGVRPTPSLAPAARATVDDSQSLRRSHRPVASVFAVRGLGSMRAVRLRCPCRSLYWGGRGLSIGDRLAAAFGAGATRTRRPVGGSRAPVSVPPSASRPSR
jgi:amidase